MGYQGLDFGTGLSNLSNVLEQGYKDRYALQKEQDMNNRMLTIKDEQNDRMRELATQAQAHQDEYQKQQQKNALELQANAAKLKLAASDNNSAGDDKILGHIQDVMMKDKNYVQTNGIVGMAQQAKDLIALAQQNPAAKNNVAIALARLATGGQRLNMAEINAQGGSQAIIDKVNQAIASSGQGVLTPDNARFMQGLVDQVGSSAKQSLDSMNQDYAKKVSARTNYEVPDAYEKLTGIPYPKPSSNLQIQNGSMQSGQMNNPMQAPSSQVKAPPQPGEVRNGYKFNGGNPADPNSWEQQ